MTKQSGLEVCYEAFERLKANKPHVSVHVDIEHSKITAGIVSVEAGFDRGYIKKSRPAHKDLIAQIESYRNSVATSGTSSAKQLKREKKKVERIKKELDVSKQQLYSVLTQNLQLIERVRELEKRHKK